MQRALALDMHAHLAGEAARLIGLRAGGSLLL
jgi:hypothetical protein